MVARTALVVCNPTSANAPAIAGLSDFCKLHSSMLCSLQLRAAWQLDARTVLVVCDPTSPNILQFRAGREVNRLLSRPFFVELQSRYGNLYYVREEVQHCSHQQRSHRVMSSCCRIAEYVTGYPIVGHRPKGYVYPMLSLPFTFLTWRAGRVSGSAEHHGCAGGVLGEAWGLCRGPRLA